jgi:hypothetical protein
MDANALKDWKDMRRLNWWQEKAVRDARERRWLGRTLDEARDLYCEAAKSAAICGECFRPLAPMDSVTMGYQKIGERNGPFVRVPICLLCSISAHIKPDFIRTRCRNCDRPLRLYRPSWRPGWRSDLDAPFCCRDCPERAQQAQAPGQARADDLHRMRRHLHPETRRRDHVLEPMPTGTTPQTRNR